MNTFRKHSEDGHVDYRLRRFFGFGFAGISDFGTWMSAFASLSNASNPLGLRGIALLNRDWHPKSVQETPLVSAAQSRQPRRGLCAFPHRLVVSRSLGQIVRHDALATARRDLSVIPRFAFRGWSCCLSPVSQSRRRVQAIVNPFPLALCQPDIQGHTIPLTRWGGSRQTHIPANAFPSSSLTPIP